MAIHNFAAAWMTDEHQMLFDTASRFFKEQWAPKDEAWRQAGMMDRSAWEEAGANGFLCASMPEEYGGAGGDFGHEAVLILAQGAAGLSGFTNPTRVEISDSGTRVPAAATIPYKRMPSSR